MVNQDMQRPDIYAIDSGAELKKWYWLKTELTALARHRKISAAGGKTELLDRLADALDGRDPVPVSSTPPVSSFDWATERLTPETVITDSYRNGTNARQFFLTQCGHGFAFSIPFMAWMKANTGKTLRDAVAEWKRLQEIKKDSRFRSYIPESNQYNQYIRDFLAANPDKTSRDARACWKKKRQLPVGRHFYEPQDLLL